MKRFAAIIGLAVVLQLAAPIAICVAQTEGIELAGLREGGNVAWWQRVLSFVGLLSIVGIAWLMSSHRKKPPWRIIGWGLGLQIVFALFVLKTDAGMKIFGWLNDAVVRLLTFTDDGTKFIFGSLFPSFADPSIAGNTFSFAINVLPTIIFFSSLMSVLYYLGVLQRVVRGLAWIMQRTMGTSGAETLSAAANIFVGQTEAPLVIKPYVDKMTKSELNAVMVGGFATVAGGVMAAYVGMLKSQFPDIAGHLIAASVMSAPAALVIAKVMMPETETPETATGTTMMFAAQDANIIDAAARGAGEGLKLALNVGAMLLAFLALIAFANFLIGLPAEFYNDWVGHVAWEPMTIERMLGYLFWPIAFLMGVPPADCMVIGGLLGEKMVLTEFVAYLHLGQALQSGEPALSYRSVVIVTYALCGFANFGSIAIQIGGIGGIAPGRRSDLAKLGLRAMIGGTLAACMTATVAGMLL